MKTRISPNNPFGVTRRLEHAFCWERVNEYATKNGPPRILDFGTHDGAMLYEFAKSGIVSQAVGVDVNPAAVSSLAKNDAHVALMSIEKGSELPFPASCFDVVCLIGVLEHVHRQDFLLSELRRVLVDEGRLILSVPGQHTFSFMDLGNLKFRFPRLHSWYYTRKHSVEDYERRYVEGENGLIGDIEVEKRWHEHFRLEQLESLLADNGFKVMESDGFGFFMRPIHNLWALSPVMKQFLYRLMLRDMWAFNRAEIFVECEKSPVRSNPRV